MTELSDRKKASGRLPLILLGGFAVACLVALLFLGDLARYQETATVAESQTALRDVGDPAELGRTLRRYPANRILRLIAQASDKSTELETAAHKMLDEAVPDALAKPANLAGSSLGDLGLLRRDIKAAESNIAALAARMEVLVRAKREELLSSARLLGVDSPTLARFMAAVDEQHADLTAHVSKGLAARAMYYGGYEKCIALLIREFGSYRVTNGQFIFRLQPTADSYNAASVAMGAAAKGMSERDDDGARLRQLQLDRWKKFVGGLT